MKNLIFGFAVLASLPAQAFTQFSGGLCATQGSWMQAALNQAATITTAIEALRDDPACKALVGALDRSPKVDAKEQEGSSSFANSYRELTSIGDYLNPSRMSTSDASVSNRGLYNKEFQKTVFNMVFNKGYEALKDIRTEMNANQFSEGQNVAARETSVRLSNFLDKTKVITNQTIATTKNILAVLPQSQACLHNKPSISGAIFGSIAHSAASLVSAGEVNGVGELASVLLNLGRELDYMKALKGIELEKFKSSVSCLVESTSEAYCAVGDAEESLEFLKPSKSQKRQEAVDAVVKNTDKDPIGSSLGGLVIYMRDIPVVQNWVQRVLFGIAPRIAAQGTEKNKYLSAYLEFVKSINTLQSAFNDREQLYRQNTVGKSNDIKLGQVKEIFDTIVGDLSGRRGGSDTNFFLKTVKSEDHLPFAVIGIPFPADYNTRTNDFSNYWTKWAQTGSNGFDDPDTLLTTVRQNLWKLMEKAQIEANALFSSRMVVDSHNLIAEAMTGTLVSPYQGFVHQRDYYSHLIEKLGEGAASLEGNAEQDVRRKRLLAHIPLLKDSVERLNKVIKALDSAVDIGSAGGGDSPAIQSQKIMEVVYEAGNMLVSWDSFFGTRMQTALQADLSDTLWRRTDLNDRQKNYFYEVGPEIVAKLSGFFTRNPVTERTDLNAAKMVHIANLKSVEQLFAKVLFNEIVAINCKLEGGYSCSMANHVYDPAKNDGNIRELNAFIISERNSKGKSKYKDPFSAFMGWLHPPTEDSSAHDQVKAKLCIQALAFESRDKFRTICEGTKMVSEFAELNEGLNTSFDEELAEIEKLAKGSSTKGHFDMARSRGVCSLRSYIRKNHVYFMNSEYAARVK